MKRYSEMNEDERDEYIAMLKRVLRVVMDESYDSVIAPYDRPACVCLWVSCGSRSPVNAWTAYDVDKEAFITDAMHAGHRFLLNIPEVISEAKGNPQVDQKALEQVSPAALRSLTNIVNLLTNPAYRIRVKYLIENFFEDCRERGAL